MATYQNIFNRVQVHGDVSALVNIAVIQDTLPHGFTSECELGRFESCLYVALITISFNIEIENVSGIITVCIPFSNLVPIKEKLMGDFAVEEVNTDPFWAREIKELINSVPVDLNVHLGKTQLTANELINLSVGDVIPLNKFIEDDLELLVEGVKKFSGLPGTYHSNNAIQISKLEDRR